RFPFSWVNACGIARRWSASPAHGVGPLSARSGLGARQSDAGLVGEVLAGLAPVGHAAEAGGELSQVAGQAHAAQVAVAAAEGALRHVDGGAGISTAKR